MSRLTRAIKFGTIGGSVCGAGAFIFAAGAHIADPVRPSRHTPGKIVGGETPWSLVGIIAGAGFGFGFVVGGIFGACSYRQTYNPPVLVTPLLAKPASDAEAAVIDIQPNTKTPTSLQVDVEAAATEALVGKSPSNGRVSPLAKLSFLAPVVTSPQQAVTAPQIAQKTHETPSPVHR